NVDAEACTREAIRHNFVRQVDILTAREDSECFRTIQAHNDGRQIRAIKRAVDRGKECAVNFTIDGAAALKGNVRRITFHAPQQERINVCFKKTLRLVGPGLLEVINPLLEETYRSAGFHSSAFVRN